MNLAKHLEKSLFVWEEPVFPMPAWLLASRKQYFDILQTKELPTKKQEQFRYTDLNLIKKQLSAPHHLQKNENEPLVSADKITLESIRLVFINQVFYPLLSDMHLLPPGVIACSLEEAVRHHEALLKEGWPQAFNIETQPFACLNLASVNHGFFFYVPASVDFSIPVHLLHMSNVDSASTSCGLHVMVLDENCRIAIFEEHRYEKNQPTFYNNVCSLLVKKNAIIDYTLLSMAHEKAINWRTTTVAVKEGGHASFVSCCLGGEFSRHDFTCRLEEDFANCTTSGYYHAKEAEYIDNHIDMLHLAPHTTSDMLFKGTLTDSAKAVFNGRLFVEKNAQKIVGFQANHHLLFSDQAESYSKPELEIYADDVKCKHGATTASFDHEAIFYLRSRGLTEMMAKMLLLDAFLSSVLDRIALPVVFVDHIKHSVKQVSYDV